MDRTSKTITSEIVTLRLDADVTDQERSDETVRLLGEYQEALRVELQKALETKPFSLICTGCDADGPDTYDKAIAEGWTEVAPDDGISWNFLGYCSDCTKSA
jgi:hypothetical protein